MKGYFKALVVEDDETWQAILRNALEIEGCRVQVAESYDEARAALESEIAFHLILIDRYLAGFTPVAEGEMLLQYLVRHCKGIPCIVITGEASIQSAVDAFKCFNVFDYIEKSRFSVHTFGDTVRQALSKAKKEEEETMVRSEKQLRDMQAQMWALEQTLGQLEEKWKSGDLESSQYFRLLESRNAERKSLITDIQMLLRDRGVEELDDALEKVKANRPEDEIKDDLKQVAKKEGWSDKIVEQINRHKGGIVSLIITIALESGKRMVG